jgi:hypothetical protein
MLVQQVSQDGAAASSNVQHQYDFSVHWLVLYGPLGSRPSPRASWCTLVGFEQSSPLLMRMSAAWADAALTCTRTLKQDAKSVSLRIPLPSTGRFFHSAQSACKRNRSLGGVGALIGCATRPHVPAKTPRVGDPPRPSLPPRATAQYLPGSYLVTRTQEKRFSRPPSFQSESEYAFAIEFSLAVCRIAFPYRPEG